MKILSFGSLNFDHFYQTAHFVAPKETLAATAYRRGLGGKGFNQTVAMAQAGAMVFQAGRCGRDGQPFIDYLTSRGVDTSWLQLDSSQPTGHAIIELCQGQNRILLCGGANQAITREQIATTLAAFTPDDLLVIQNEISNIPFLISEARRRGLRIFFNAAPMSPAVATYPLNQVDWLCLNEVEATGLADFAYRDFPELAQMLYQQLAGPAILLTLGEQGAIYIDSEQTIAVPAHRVTALDTTAAGDTFCGYFVAALAQGEPVENGLELATTAAALAVQRAGAAASIPTMEEVLHVG